MSDVKITASDQELQAVVLFAAEAHGNQFRKHSHLPYITHPFQVLSLVAEWNVCNPESVKAGTPVYDLITWKSALCHDIREERPDITQKMLEALKKYGMIVADNGSDWFISGATDSRWNDTDLDQLKRVPGAAFEVVDTGPIQR
jgi:(p)ppGpp synthase/HD superfamily hydrolase